jgi:hypothetical protein
MGKFYIATFIYAAAMVMALPLVANAAEKPSEIGATIRAAAPVGGGKLKRLFMSLYEVSFWSDSGDWKKAPYALTITYAMNFSAQELTDVTLTEMQNISDQPHNSLKIYADQLTKLLPNVASGDRITAIAMPTGYTAFYHNGRALGTIRDAVFTPLFFGVWLSPKTSEPELRQQLLHLTGE